MKPTSYWQSSNKGDEKKYKETNLEFSSPGFWFGLVGVVLGFWWDFFCLGGGVVKLKFNPFKCSYVIEPRQNNFSAGWL
jgi:membrane protein YqaA with SNARE-associated domain